MLSCASQSCEVTVESISLLHANFVFVHNMAFVLKLVVVCRTLGQWSVAGGAAATAELKHGRLLEEAHSRCSYSNSRATKIPPLFFFVKDNKPSELSWFAENSSRSILKSFDKNSWSSAGWRVI